MTNRERFQAALSGRPKDRLPMIEWADWWDKTVARWEDDGLPVGLKNPDVTAYWELDPMLQFWLRSAGEGCPRPAGHGLGIIQDEADYNAIRPYLYQDRSIHQLVEWMQQVRPRRDSGEAVVWLTFEGFFWFPRTLLGIEPHLYSFYDCPDLLHRINQDQSDFCLKAIDAACTIFPPDFVTIAEDMSYNHGPMLSKSLFDEFIAPYYKKVVPALQSYGVSVLIDTDGDVEPMISWFSECGIEGVLPLERQAGVDVSRIRQQYPKWKMLGGFDKTIMHLGEAAMRQEFERLLPVMRMGSFIPAVDHQTPPDVSLENYRIFRCLYEEYARKAVQETI